MLLYLMDFDVSPFTKWIYVALLLILSYFFIMMHMLLDYKLLDITEFVWVFLFYLKCWDLLIEVSRSWPLFDDSGYVPPVILCSGY